MADLIMSWSECSVEIGKTGASDALATALTSVGVIKEKTTTMETNDGDKLVMKKTGGKVVAQEASEGEITIKTRVIEPDFAFLATVIGATHDTTKKELKVSSLLVNTPYSVKITPKNVGATGVRVRKSQLNYKEGYSEDEGHYAELTFTVLACEDGELYTKFTKS